MSDVTQLLRALEGGEDASDELLEAVYGELRCLAASKLARERGQSLQATALVHEAWMRIAGSGEAAARFAERENASDRLNGIDVGGQSDVVSTILVELSQRRTQDQSAELARLIRREGEGAIRFHPQAQRSAALKVLRAPDVPSVLFESGYITNEGDAQRLASAEGRARFAKVIARAIRVYFARQQAG